jgi:L-seryl-tRNA(Ser) seleniumtransferase
MTEQDAARLYAELGTRPVVNAAGAYTLLGGSTVSPGVQAAMEAANLYFADMRSLLESSGRVIADLLGVEAACVTAGAATALVLSVAACLTRDHRDYLERLPDTEGIPNEVLVQKSTRQKYDRCLTVPGARIIEVGDEQGLTPAQLAAAIGPRTVAVHYFVPLKGPLPGVPPLESVVEVAHARGLPVIVDAAGHTYPLDYMRQFARAGADLVCYAAKYFDAPHSTGMVVGRKEFVDLVALNSFIGFETSGYLTFGRPMKVDRQEIFGLVAALKEWLAMDHEARLLLYGARIETLLRTLAGVPGIETYRISDREQPEPVLRDGVRILFAPGGKTAAQVFEALRDGDPCIWTRLEDDHLNVSVAFFKDDEEELVGQRLRAALTA